ncbi:MAG: ribulokinase [Spirochaetaceae bacterium]|nr:MAG: ribulokinase [Spirochaetaceae bacterium]
MSDNYCIGLDYGTNSVRAVIVNTANGDEIAESVWDYAHGEAGIILDARDPNLARQHPRDYLDGARAVIRDALSHTASVAGFEPAQVIGIGVDTTGSTPMPLAVDGAPLAFSAEYGENPAAMAWLWKDHTSAAEAEEITSGARKIRPQFLAKCGGIYSSEWFWSKLLKCKRSAQPVFDAAHTWVEIADWIPAQLCGVSDPARIKRGICAAGHKALFHTDWGGYPDEEFLTGLDPDLARVRRSLPDAAYTVDQQAGRLSPEWARETGLPAGIPVAVGAFDAHLGAVGSGIRPGVLVKILGTSTCDMMVVPRSQQLADIPGLCGIVPGSILPGHFGLEAGQSAVGDIFNWFVNYVQPGGAQKGSHEALTAAAEKLAPGESGLLGLDWHNGNRTVLVDVRLTGALLGLTLHSRPEEIYRALVESTAFGARVIMERFEEYDQRVTEIVNCGGISVKNPMVMQIYADVMNRPLKIARSRQTPAVGAAMAGAVVAGTAAGGHRDFDAAIEAMTGTLDTEFMPIARNARVYDRLYALYRRIHDAFGVLDSQSALSDVMKELIAIRDETRAT